MAVIEIYFVESPHQLLSSVFLGPREASRVKVEVAENQERFKPGIVSDVGLHLGNATLAVRAAADPGAGWKDGRRITFKPLRRAGSSQQEEVH